VVGTAHLETASPDAGPLDLGRAGESGGTDQAKTTIHDVTYGHRNGKNTEKKLLMKAPRQGAREAQHAPDLLMNPPLPRAIPLHSVTLLAATGYERKNL
jgi:hypothetical protein